MKILAIRGKNLASLAGEFDIDFRREPLATAGLFAISGPTGAGKSTLLDALCLALYDATPRLRHAGGRGASLPDVGEETISPADARNLLRRGTSEGYAEVEFVGNDGQAYRARWSVRRARGRSGGKLQNAEMSLLSLAGEQRIGALKSEVLAEIRARLGLNFEQFTRAVLLAQNEFSAFLKAPDDERANLLETLTGTDQYSRLSKRAFERAKAESEALKLLQAQLQGQQPLPIDERAALDQQHQETARLLAQQQQQQAELDRQIAWHRQQAQLQQAEQQAGAALREMQQEQSQAQARRQQLAAIETAQPARGLLDEQDRARRELQQSQVSKEQAQAALVAAAAEELAAAEQLRQSRQALQQAEQNQAEAQPELQRARRLDAEIGLLTPGHAQHRQALDSARAAQAEAEQAHREKTAQQAETRAALAESQAWLEANSAWEILGTQWPRWDEIFAQARSAQTSADTAAAALDVARQAIGEAQSQRSQAEQHLAQAQTRYRSAEQAQQQAEQVLAGFDAAALAQSHQQATQRREQLRETAALEQALLALLAEQAALENQRAQTGEQLRQQEAGLAATQSRLPALHAAYEQAARMLKIAEAACAENVEHLRAALQDGSPCPVCGASEHPYAAGSHPFQQQLAALAAELESCRLAVKEAENQESRWLVQLEQTRRQRDTLLQTLAALAVRLDETQAAYREQPCYGECQSVPETQRADWFSAQLAQLEEQIRAIAGGLEGFTAANEAAKQARQALEQAGQQQRQAQQAFEAADSRLRAAELAVHSESGKLADAQARLAGHLDNLDAALAETSWRDAWRQDPAGYYRRCETQAQAWLAQRDQAHELQGQATLLQAECAGLAASLAKAGDHAKAAQEAFAALDSELAEKRRERAGLLGGRALAEVETAFEQAIATARQAQDMLAEQAQHSAKQHSRCQEALQQAENSSADRQRALAGAEAALAAWLADSAGPLEEARLRELLSHDNGWIAGERQALQKIDEAAQKALAVWQERQRQCAEHAEQWPESETPEALQERRQVLEGELQALQAQHSEIALQRRQDDERRQASTALLEQIAAQEARSNTWAKLGELIGSADGKKFRNIAQQLTLDILLGYANRHLRDLSHRYRLERVKDSLALQVVDQDMGDEIRSVHSLSGGESFLVSLALALGLASLSSNRVRVESLFIDEGFGSLDADTLRVAMDALDSLQSLGRKVGVISHVQEMTERIGTRIQVRRSAGGQSSVSVQ